MDGFLHNFGVSFAYGLDSKNHIKTFGKPWFYWVFCTLWVLGRGGWGILGTVSGDVGSKKVIFRGSWGYVVIF